MKKIYLFISLCVLFVGPLAGSDSIVFHHITEKLSQSTITTIFQDDEGFLWFGTRYGLNKYDGRFFQKYLHDPNDSTSLSDNRINDVAVDKQGNFWISTDRGVNYFDRIKGEMTRFFHNPKDPNSLSSDFSICLLLDHQDKLWIGTEDQGLSVFDPATNEFTRYKHLADDPFSISSNNISDIAADHQGNLWVGTLWAGVNYLDRSTRRFITYDLSETEANNSVRCLLPDGPNLWVGTHRGLIKIVPESGGHKIYRVSELGLSGLY